MKLNQGGSVLIYILIIISVVAAIAAFVLNIRAASKPSSLSEANAASIRDMGQHLQEIDRKIKSLKEGNQDHYTATETLKGDIEDAVDFMEANKLEIDRLKSRSDKNDQIMVANQNKLNKKFKALPRLIDRKIAAMNRPVEVTLTPQKTVGYERVVRRKGKNYKQMIYKSLPLEKKKKDEKFNMPGIKEAKDQLVNNEL